MTGYGAESRQFCAAGPGQPNDGLAITRARHNFGRAMTQSESQISAVLGPTNTGKTHLAVERFCAHSSGIMGFPLRLLAREIYDRVVAIKGAHQVGLITGEERILPPDARWILCTAESMPLDRDVAFVALDEAQLGADTERGHVFTDRMLRARGRNETMILGSETLRPMVRALIPEAEITNRPRFSKLSYDGPKKLSRLPPRSVIVAFSADQVYAVAEALRRSRGGAAVVMGALSPRTRNAQVAMFQAGEVDYLVATDAIGMGLNLDVGHVAFAGLTKFDGKKQRRLTIPEMAQIAGRAGRHHRDGTFGVLQGGPDTLGFTDVEIDRIEEHRFLPLDHLFWRNAELDYASVPALIESLEAYPDQAVLRPAPEAVDLAVLKAVATDPALADRMGQPALVRRLWDACGLPDFRKLGVDHHARLVASIFAHLSSGTGHLPHDWVAREVERLNSVEGDVATLAGRIAAARTWAYVAHRADWLADPSHWAGRTGEVEERLSDALHRKLTERFVDRRTAILMRTLGDTAWLDVNVADDGTVSVSDEPIGHLSGFRFTVDPSARLGERKRLLAAAEARLPAERARRVTALAAAADAQFALAPNAGAPVAVFWQGSVVATLKGGKGLLAPAIVLDPAAVALPLAQRDVVIARLDAWLSAQLKRHLSPLLKMQADARAADTPPPLRALLSQLVERGGVLSRAEAEAALAMFDVGHKRRLHQLGIVLGTLDVFHPAALKPGAAQLRVALACARGGKAMMPLPMPGLGLLDHPSPDLISGAQCAGYRSFGKQMLRVDLVERIARAAHDARGKDRVFAPDQQIATSLGIGTATYSAILRALGFQPAGQPGHTSDPPQWRWTGRPRVRSAARPINAAFAALSALQREN
jgi:ATP-dependent RNA helicase SUPV3L1/SUV3